MARRRIPGLANETEIALLGVIDDLTRRLDALEHQPPAPPVIQGNFTAREGQFLRIVAPTSGLTLTLPKPRSSNRAARITLAFETTNTVTIRCVDGLVNAEEYVLCALVGTFDAICNGATGWSVGLGVTSSGATPGPTGAAGADGSRGLPGDKGEPGDPGDMGPPGTPGAAGAVGARGQAGEDGNEGPPGDMGPPGVTGATGATGQQGPPGIEGEPGQPGDMGDPGATGATGATGLTGSPGDIGDPGEPGDMGPPGPTGGTGATGATGSPGDVGDAGPEGDPGMPGAALGDGVRGDLTITGGATTWTVNAAAITNAKLANMGPRTVKGRQTDAVTGVPVDLTGDELSENLRRNTIQTLSGVSGDLNVTLNDDTTVLLIRSTADTRLLSLSAGTGGGREILVEHDRLSGSGMLTLAHNNGSGTLFKLFLRKGVDAVLDQGECVTLRDRSSFWRMNDGPLSVMAAGTVKGRALGGGTGVPVDLTPAQVGAIARWTGVEVFSLAGGATYTLTLLETTTHVYITTTGTGDVAIDEIIHGASNSGARIIIAKNTGSTSARVVIRYNAAKGSNKIDAPGPGSGDWVLEGIRAGVALNHNAFTWGIEGRQNSNAALADMAARTIKGRAVGAGTGVPVDLTGAQVGEIARRQTSVVDATVSGSVPLYAIAEATTQVRFTGSGTATIHSLTFDATTVGKEVEFHIEAGATLVLTFAHESGSGTGGLNRCPGGTDFVLRANESVRATGYDNRWRFDAVARLARADGLGPLLSNLAVPFLVVIPLTSGGASGTLDDVTVWAAAAPFALTIVDAILLISTAGPPASAAALRTATGGGGSNVFGSATFTTTSTGRKMLDQTAGAAIAAGGSLYLNRDRSVVGTLWLTCYRT